jgi:hypothetical protein
MTSGGLLGEYGLCGNNHYSWNGKAIFRLLEKSQTEYPKRPVRPEVPQAGSDDALLEVTFMWHYVILK